MVMTLAAIPMEHRAGPRFFKKYFVTHLFSI